MGNYISNKDYLLIEKIFSMTQEGLYQAMHKVLFNKYDSKVIATKEYIVAIGDIPIALVAHLDTVFPNPVSELYYDQDKGIFWSPNGLGADDRAGVYAILKIIQSGLRPSIIFTTDEERGGVGAAALAAKECPIKDLKYIIELDRQGIDDCVFYDCYNPTFIEYISSFGFKHEWGTFSDISFLMSPWKICGVNLSVGYKNEHSYCETLNIRHLNSTIEKVKTMLKEETIPEFVYDEISPINAYHWENNSQIFGQHCSNCRNLFSEYELIPVIDDDKKVNYFCCDCVVANDVEWCDNCGEAFITKHRKNKRLCACCEEGGLSKINVFTN